MPGRDYTDGPRLRLVRLDNYFKAFADKLAEGHPPLGGYSPRLLF